MPWDPGADFVAKTKAFASLFNNKFDSLAAYTSDIPPADLADDTPGRLIVVGSGGVPAYVAASGEAALSAGGAFTLKQKTRYHGQTSDKDLINAGVVPGLQTAALDTGSWLVFGKIEVEQSSGAHAYHARFQLEKSAVTAIAQFRASAEENATGTGMSMGLLTSGGSDYARMTFTGPPVSLSGVATRGILLAIKVT